MRIILPKRDFKVSDSLPYFYLIGPVLGGGDWQVEMCIELGKHAGDCQIAVPCRWDDNPQFQAWHPLSRYCHPEKSPLYSRQLFWEQEYIDKALHSKSACVVCWLGSESKENPRRDGNPYGIDTLGEMNYFRGLLESRKNLPIVAGGEDGFPRFTHIIKPNFEKSFGKPFPFHDSIEKTARAASELVL